MSILPSRSGGRASTIGLVQLLITYWPGAIGNKLRYRFWSRKLRHLGHGTIIDVGCHFQNPRFISIGEACWIDRNVIILAGPPVLGRKTHTKANPSYGGMAGEVHIGERTHIAPNCVISGMGGLFVGRNCTIASNSCVYSFSHHYRDLDDADDPYQYSFSSMARPDQQAMIQGAIVLGDYCAVGLASVILPGVTLGRGAWVACNSVVTRSIPAQQILMPGATGALKDISHLSIKT